jgi:chromosome segregation ATPase
MNTYTIGIALVGFLIGFLIAWLITRSRAQRVAEEMEVNNRALQKKIDERDRDLKSVRAQVDSLTAGKSAVDGELMAANTRLSEIESSVAAMGDRLNAALAAQMTAEAAMTEAQSELARAQTDAADLARQLENESATRRQVAQDLEERERQVNRLSRDLADTKEAWASELSRADVLAKSFLLTARLEHGAKYPVNAQADVAQLVQDADPAVLRDAFLALAAIKSHGDALLRERDIELVDSAAKIAAMRYSLNIMTANSAQLAVSRLPAPAAPVSYPPDLLTDLEVLRMEAASARASADSAAADTAALGISIQERDALIAGLRMRIAEALSSLQPLIAEGENGAHLASDEIAAETVEQQTEEVLEEAENLIDVEDLALVDGADLSVDAAASEGGAQAADGESVAEPLSETERLTAGVAGVLVAFARKNQALDDLRAALDAAVVEKDELAAALNERSAAYDGVMVSIDGLSDELERAVQPASSAPGAASEIATDSPAKANADAAAQPVAADANVVAASEVEAAGEAVEIPAEEIEQAPLTGIARLTAAVSAVLAVLRERDGELVAQRSAPAEIPLTDAALTDDQSQVQGMLAELTGQISNWLEQLRTRFADDPEVLAVLAGATVAGETQPDDGEQAAVAVEAAPAPEMQDNSVAPAAPVETVEVDHASAPPPAQPKPISQFNAGIAAVALALQKREVALTQLQGDGDALSASNGQLTGELAQRNRVLDDLAAHIAAAQAELQSLAVDVPEVAALFAVASSQDGAPEEPAGEEPAQASAEPAKAEPETMAAPTAEGDADAAALAQEDAAPQEDLTSTPALAGVAQLTAGIAALGAAVHARNESLAKTQSDLDETTAAKVSLEDTLAEQKRVIAEVDERVSGGAADLQGEADDNPDVAEALAAPVEEAAEEDESEEKRTGKRVLARLAVFLAGVSALRKRMHTRNEELAAAKADVESLTIHQTELEAALQQSGNDLNSVVQRISAVQSEFESAAADLPELIARSALVQQVAPDEGESAEQPVEAAAQPAETSQQEPTSDETEAAEPIAAPPSPVAQANASLEKLSAGIAAFVAALHSKDDALNALRDDLQARLDAAGLSMDDLSQRIAALVDQFQALAADDPDLQAVVESANAAADSGVEASAEVQEQPTPTVETAEAAETTAPAEEDALAKSVGKLGVVAAGLAALGELMRKRRETIAGLTSDVDSGLAAQSDLQGVLSQRDAELSDIDGQIDLWRAELLSAIGDDADLAAVLQPAAIEPESVEGAETLPVTRVALLAAGVAATKGLLEKNQNGLAALQAALDDMTVAKTTLEADLAQRTADLDALHLKIAAAHDALRSAVADDEELAALFDQTPQPEAVVVEGAPEETAVAPEGAVAVDVEATAQAAIVVIARRGEAIASLQSALDGLTAEKTQLDQEFADRESQLADLNARIVEWRDQLQASIADDPEAQALLAGAAPEEEGQRRAGIAVLGASAAAANAALDKKRSQLTDADALTAELQALVNSLDAERVAIEETLQQNQQQVSDLQAQVDSLSKQISHLNDELEAEKVAKAETEDELKATQEELDQLMEKIAVVSDRLRDELGDDELAEEFGDDEPRAARLAKAGILAAGVSQVAKNRQEKSEALEATNARLAETEQQLAALTAEKSALEGTLQEKDAALADAQTQAAGATEEIARLQGELDAAVAARAQLEGEVQKSQGELADLLGDIRRLQAELEAEMAEDDDLKSFFAARSPEQISAETSVDAGEEAPVTAKVAEIGLLTAGVAAALDAIRKKNSSLSDSNHRIADVEAAVAALTADKEQMEASLQAKDAALAEGSTTIDALSAEKSALEATLQEKEGALTEAQSQIDALNLTAEERAAAIETLNGQIAELQTELTATQAEKAQLESELAAKDAELVALQAELAQTKEEGEQNVAGKVAEIAALTAAAAAASRAIEEKNQELEQANAQVAALQQQLDAAKAEQERAAAEAQSQAAALQSKVDSRTDQIGKLQDQNADLERENRNLQRQVSSLESEVEEQRAEERRRRAAGAVVVAAGTAAAVGSRQERSEEEEAASQADARMAEMQKQMADLQAQLAAVTAAQSAAAAQPAPEFETRAAPAVAVIAVQAESAEEAVVAEAAPEEAAGEEVVEATAEDAIAEQIGGVEAAEDVAVEEIAVMEAASEEAAVEEIVVMEAAEEAVPVEAASEEAAVEEIVVTEAAEEAVPVEAASEEAAVEEIVVTEAAEEAVAEEAASEEAAVEEIVMMEAAEEAASEELAEEAVPVDAAEEGAEGALLGLAAAAGLSEAVSTEEAAPVDASAAPAAAAGEVTIRTASILQDLAQVHGIGATLERRLHHAGIGTFWELATASRAELVNALGLTGIARESVDLEAIQADAMRLAEETFTVGLTWDKTRVDDLSALPRLGDTYKRRLYEAGIINFESLSQLTPDQLAEICRAPKVNPPDFEEWIRISAKWAEELRQVKQ